MTASRSLSEAELEKLLVSLADDRNAAALKLVALRARLEKFFEWSRCGAHAGELAWEVLARVARRLHQGEEILKVEAYAAGVARLVAKEELARVRRESGALAELEIQARALRDTAWGLNPDAREVAAQALEKCLGALTLENRDILLRYYQGEEGARIKNRKRLALELGISLNALRNRALRLRETVEIALREEIARNQAR